MAKGQKIIDISPLVSPQTAVYPGDVPFRREESMSTKAGQHLTLSSITTTTHVGAHTDAPNHYHRDGAGIDSRPLSLYYGPCQVIRVKLKRGERILPEHLGKTKISAPRVLFRTDSFPNPDRWNNDFNSLSPELVHFLAKKKVVLVGIDTPSIDPADSKALESHQAIYSRDLAILEGIILTKAAPGKYTLAAFPLKLAGADASPVRAVLLTNSVKKK